MTYKTWLETWLENYVRPTAKFRTFCRYKNVCQLHIIPQLGNYQVEDLTPMHLQKHVMNLLSRGNCKNGGGLAPTSVNVVVSIVQNSLQTAQMVGIASQYVADKIKRPKIVERKITCFSVLEQKKLEQFVLQNHPGKLFGIVLCLYTGLRIGELLALTWDDVDLSTGMLSVSKSCQDHYDKNGYVRIVESPKTTNSMRVIPVPKQLVPMLKKLKRSIRSKYVISDAGLPIRVRSYQRTFQLVQKKLGIQYKGFHSLRHTFATRALECGVDVKTLSELLGHKNATITLNRYAHSLLEHKVQMMNKLGKML